MVKFQRLKDKFFDIPEIKQMRDKYYELKSYLSKNKKLKNKQNELNEPYKCVTKIVLVELRNIKLSLINSANDIEKIFKLPLSNLNATKKKVITLNKIQGKKLNFNIEDMLREEFVNTIMSDEFICALIIQIKSITEQLNIDEINELIELLEEDLESEQREMTRFTDYLGDLLKVIIEESKIDEEEINDNTSAGSNHVNTNTNMNIKPANGKNDKCKDLDEWVQFIEAAEDRKPKRRNKKKKTTGAVTITINEEVIVNKTNITNSDNIEDKEIEDFKNTLEMNTKKAGLVRKIRPLISKEWINNITQGANL